jgi:hypothetical protein
MFFECHVSTLDWVPKYAHILVELPATTDSRVGQVYLLKVVKLYCPRLRVKACIKDGILKELKEEILIWCGFEFMA